MLASHLMLLAAVYRISDSYSGDRQRYPCGYKDTRVYLLSPLPRGAGAGFT